MISTGQLWWMVKATIVLIALQFAPVVAQAHPGHEHGVHGKSLQSQGAAAADISIVSDDRAANSAAQIQRADEFEMSWTSNHQKSHAASDAAGCAIGCCGAGTVCCGGALSPVPPGLPPIARQLRVSLVGPIRVTGMDPEGLRKPPRSFV